MPDVMVAKDSFTLCASYAYDAGERCWYATGWWLLGPDGSIEFDAGEATHVAFMHEGRWCSFAWLVNQRASEHMAGWTEGMIQHQRETSRD